MSHPACFDSAEQWKAWCAMAKQSQHSVKQYCTDCSAEYRDRMIGAQRCGHPETVFVLHRYGGIVGVTGEDRGWEGAATGQYEGSGVKKSSNRVVATASPQAIMEEMKRRKSR